MISEKEMSSLFSEVQEAIVRLDIPATFFEMATFLAFVYFQRTQVDIAVIETGFGGDWDATNVITPLVSVITSIGYDHTDILGTSLEDIAAAKAGIIKKGVPVVIGPDVPYPFMKEKADALDCPLHQSPFQNEDFDQENQETAGLALTLIRPYFPVSKEAMNAGLKTKPPCRFERYSHSKEVIFDVAHNSHGFARLMQMLAHTYPHHEYRFVVGFSKGKDVSACARLIQEKACAIHLVSGEHPRLAQIQEFQGAFMDGKTALHLEKTIGKGVQNALQAASAKPEVLIIAGSFFIMSEARKALGLKDPEDPCLWYDPLRTLIS
jgi:dihydrofolate synthase/folylpolyglutamate synthase